MSIYDFTVTDDRGDLVSLEQYRGKVLLIVNTATGCGFTPQYKDLQSLYESYQNKGFVVLDFPCNQFGKRAPGTNAEISSFCEINYKTSFPRFSKIDVNGAYEEPMFTYLKSQQGGVLGNKIKWNFTKFLIDRKGNVLERYSPLVNPKNIESRIKSLLKE